MTGPFSRGAVVLVHLSEPNEKLWGVVEELNHLGLVLRGLNVGTFEDWMAEAASRESPSLGLASMFLPMRRVDRIFIDEQIGEVESYCQRFERRVGITIADYIGLDPHNDPVAPS